MKRSIICSLLGLSLTLTTSPPALHAQTDGIHPGDEVRVSWWDPYGSGSSYQMPRMTTAEVIDFNGNALMLKRGSHIFTVPVSEVRSVQRRVGTKPASAPAMVAGSAAGFATGYLIGALSGGIQGGSSDVDRAEAGLTTGVLIGAPVGALVAWLASRSRGIYQEVPFSDMLAGVVVHPNGSVGLSIKAGGR